MTQQDVHPPFKPTTRPTAVIGGGTLGSRIALMLASSGGEVRLYDAKPAQLDIAKRFIDSQLPRVVKVHDGGVAGRLVYVESLEDAIVNAWMVVEAVPEILDLKRKIFGDLDRLAPPDVILATNSSSYPSSQIIDLVSNATRVVNTHYYMPPETNAVEVMSCGKTDDKVIAELMERLPLYGLVPFHVKKESVGFIFNRIWAALKRESLEVVEEGVSTPAEVDRIFALVLGTRAGPFRWMDEVGLDVVLDIEEHYAAIYPELPVGPRELLKQYVSEGRLGVKTGQGFYTDYQQQDPAAAA